MNLRKKINTDLEASMEGSKEWGLPVELVAPDGTEYKTKKGTTEVLTGQVLYNRTQFNPETGEDLSIDDPMVILRLNSLERIPAQDENWAVRIPSDPDPESPLTTFVKNPDKAMKFNRSIGFVIIYLQKAEQL